MPARPREDPSRFRTMGSPPSPSRAESIHPLGFMMRDFWAPAFRAGKHTDSNGVERAFSVQDIDMIVASTKAIQDVRPPKMRLGTHNKLGIKIGRVADAERRGEDLWLHFREVPTLVYEAIKKGLYDGLSIGLRFKEKVGETTWARILDHVAVLGDKFPAIKGLGDLKAYLASEPGWEGAEVEEDTSEDAIVFTVHPPDLEDKEVEAMPDNKPDASEVLLERIGKLEAKFAEAESALETAKADKIAADARAEKAEKVLKDKDTEFAQREQKAALQSVHDYCEAQVKAKKMAPAARDALLNDISDKADYAEGSVLVPWENVKNFAELHFAAPGNEQTEHAEDDKRPADQIVSEKVAAYSEEHKVDYGKAMAAVFRAEPDLKERYDSMLKEVN